MSARLAAKSRPHVERLHEPRAIAAAIEAVPVGRAIKGEGKVEAMPSARKLAARRRFVEVDICPSDAGFILSIGAMPVHLTSETAEEVAIALLDSLEVRSQLLRRRRSAPKIVESVLDLSILDLCDRRRWN